jgi:MoxR-like ATPase
VTTIEEAPPTSGAIIIPSIDLDAIPRGQVTQPLVSKMGEIFDPKTGFLATYNVEREDEIPLVLISMLAGLDPLFLGPPGTGKTWLIELTLRAMRLPTEAMFNYMVFKESSADDVLGPLSLMGLKQDQRRRMMDGYLPTTVLGYLDEVFKCSPTMANALLDLYAQRVVKVGGLVHVARQLLCIFHSSNELPDREDLGPFRDRIGLTKEVRPVRAPENRKRVLRIQDEVQAGGGRIDMTNVPVLTLEDVFQARAEVMRLPMTEAAIETLDKVVERCTGAGHEPSSRRQGQGQKAMKARAWTLGRDHVTTDDVVVLQHIFWNHPDHAKSAHDIVMEFSNVFARKASRMNEALEPVLTELERVKSEMGGGEPTDEHMEATFKVMRDLRRLRKEARDQIDQGQNQGHDVSDLEKVLDQINQAHTWIERTMTEEE